MNAGAVDNCPFRNCRIVVKGDITYSRVARVQKRGGYRCRKRKYISTALPCAIEAVIRLSQSLAVKLKGTAKNYQSSSLKPNDLK